VTQKGTCQCEVDHMMVEELKRIPSIFVPQESTRDAGEDEECSKYTKSRVEPGVQSNRGS